MVAEMIEWIKELIFLNRQYRKQKRLKRYLDKARLHALLSLAYWKKTGEIIGFRFQAQETGEYVEVGKNPDLEACIDDNQTGREF